MSTIDLHRTLRFLLALVTDAATLLALPEYTVSGIEHDSRQVRPGNIFVALAGGQSDGHQFIPQAVERGAVAIVGVRPDITISVPYIREADSRAALATLAAGFFNFPARQLTVIGVTGTDGKTTTSNLIYSTLRSAGIAAGMITTVNGVIGDLLLDTGFHVTTPEAQEIQSYLDQMVNAGLTHVVLEATSHGLGAIKRSTESPTRGRQAFYEWMLEEIPVNKLEVTALSKVYFLGLMGNGEQKRRIVVEILNKVELVQSELSEMHQEISRYEIPAPYQEVFKYQMKTLDYGLVPTGLPGNGSRNC